MYHLVLCVCVLGMGRAAGAPPPVTQKTSPVSPRTALCMDLTAGDLDVNRTVISQSRRFYCRLENGNLTKLYEKEAEISGSCVIPNNVLLSGCCKVTRIDKGGNRTKVNYTIEVIMPTPPVIITTPSTTIPVSAGTTAPAPTGSSWTGIIVAHCLVLVLGLVMCQMYRSGYLNRLLTKQKTNLFETEKRVLYSKSSDPGMLSEVLVSADTVDGFKKRLDMFFSKTDIKDY
ncbi:uncharacterized protein LOC142101874 [Mixophyes fleayi]|uniref:uncharacterized protein LOC142101874 n=1 Tax=Mixophyes fleayi TaxID=3061075 RepID=UPI003F4D7A46